MLTKRFTEAMIQVEQLKDEMSQRQYSTSSLKDSLGARLKLMEDFTFPFKISSVLDDEIPMKLSQFELLNSFLYYSFISPAISVTEQ